MILFIATVRSGVKKISCNFIKFRWNRVYSCGFICIKTINKVLNFWWSNRLKEKVFFSKKVFFIKFLLYLFYAWVGFVSIENITEYFLLAFAMWHLLKIFGRFSTTYLHNIDLVFIKCTSKCFFVSCNNVIFTRVTLLLPMKPYFVRKGLLNFQKLLLLFSPFSVTLFKYFFKDFLRNDTHMFLCFLYADTFSLEGFWFILFFNLLLV